MAEARGRGRNRRQKTPQNRGDAVEEVDGGTGLPWRKLQVTISRRLAGTASTRQRVGGGATPPNIGGALLAAGRGAASAGEEELREVREGGYRPPTRRASRRTLATARVGDADDDSAEGEAGAAGPTQPRSGERRVTTRAKEVARRGGRPQPKTAAWPGRPRTARIRGGG
jgi:hypothetical protein